MKTRSYRDLIRIPTFIERYRYLKLDGAIGDETFGLDRYLNQAFYHSSEWKHVRDKVIMRDNGCDLAFDGYTIWGRVYIHHINPLTPDQLKTSTDSILNMDNLVAVSYTTHLAIHYGDEKLLPEDPIIRKPNDTIPWR